MKKSKRILSYLLCLVMVFGFTAAAYAADAKDTAPNSGTVVGDEVTRVPDGPCTAPPSVEQTVPDELPTTVGLSIGTLNAYSMEYERCYFDPELESLMAVFRLSDAGKIQALFGYCPPAYRLSDELARLKAAKAGSTEYTLARLDVAEILNDLLMNAGGGPDYRFVPYGELIDTAAEVIQTEEFKKLVTTLTPVAELEAEGGKLDARSLMLVFTPEELAGIYTDLRAVVYGEYSLRLDWLDEMEFSLAIPLKAEEGVSSGHDSAPACS